MIDLSRVYLLVNKSNHLDVIFKLAPVEYNFNKNKVHDRGFAKKVESLYYKVFPKSLKGEKKTKDYFKEIQTELWNKEFTLK